MRLRNISVFLVLPLCVLLASCGSNKSGKYYDKDGPPSGWSSWKNETADAVPKIEKPVNAANKPYKVMGKNYYPKTGDQPMVQTGYGSWYGKQFHGKKTSIGDVYNMYGMTAAHTTMELPSYAKVTNLENGKSVIVRVNDRGPFLHDRVIDLSYAAAHKLGYANKGTAKVRVERITNKQIASGSWSSGSSVNARSLALATVATAVNASEKKTKVSQQVAKPIQIAAQSLDSQNKEHIDPILQIIESTKPPQFSSEPSKKAQEAGKKFIEEGVFTVADGGESVEETRVEMAPTQAAGNKYCIQLGVFKSYDNATRLLKKAKEEIDPQLSATGRIVQAGDLYKVQMGTNFLPDQAKDIADEVKERLGTAVYVVRE